MLINLRNAMMAGKRLPYDAEVEYLQSTGTQWIDTGVVPTNTTGVLIECTVPTNNSRDNIVIGARQDSGDTRYWIDFDWSTYDTFYFGFGSITPQAYNSLRQYEGERVQVGMNYQNGRICTVNGEKFSNLPISGSLPTITKSIYCFRANFTNPYVYSGKIFSLKITDGLTLVRDFIPVRKGTVGYLYDRVSGKLFGNAGTGDFQYGPDVVPVEYIESHGTEWIDTGYIPNQYTRWELDYQFSTIGSGSNGMFQENPTVRFNIGQGTDRFFNISYGANNALNIASDTLRHLFVADIPNLQWRLDSSSGAFPAPVSTALQYSLRIFCRNSPGGTVYNRHSGRCFASRMYQSNALSQKLLPVRVGTEGAMMDTLTRRIYRNAGTGAFTYGNDLKYPIPAE